MGEYFNGPQNVLADPLNMLFLSRLFAVHGNISATYENRKKLEEMQGYEV